MPFKTYYPLQFKLNNGFTLNTNSLFSKKGYVKNFELSSILSSFWFCLSGNEENFFLNKNKKSVLSQGCIGIFMGGKGLKGKSRIAAQTQFQMISIWHANG